jgi:nitrite reductase/ring-hydroxylating ferredoxin subunit/uncharacterized membrane protein
MRSMAHFKGHPIHPMLVAFPIAFGVSAPIFDAVGVAAEWPTVWSAGAYLAAACVVTGLAAGVPGFIDYLYTVPPESSAKRRATWHLGVNLTALALVALGWAFRDFGTLRPGVATVLLEAGGLGLMTWGGWMGGTLAYRNQIGVDHRSAHAGKWKEQSVDGKPGEAVDVGAADELKVGQMKLIRAVGRRIVLARTEGGYVAHDDRCTHRGGSLADGVLACGVVTCPWHGSQFDAGTGEVKSGPAEKSIRTYEVKESGGRVRLTLPAD